MIYVNRTNVNRFFQRKKRLARNNNEERREVMKYKILPFTALVLGISILFAVAAFASSQSFNSWYCKRMKDHLRPPLDSPMAYIKELGGYYIDEKVTDDSNDKVVYLTFDAGYENGNVSRVLDTLKEQEVPGAFFVLGNLIENNGELIKRMRDEGHLVCNHTYYHKDMTRLDAEEIKLEIYSLSEAYEELTGEVMPKYFRPPEGKFDRKSLEVVNDIGYKTIFWSFAYADWDNNRQPSYEYAKKKIIDNVHNGAVILLHPTSETNASILDSVICELREMGYRFGTLDELVRS